MEPLNGSLRVVARDHFIVRDRVAITERVLLRRRGSKILQQVFVSLGVDDLFVRLSEDPNELGLSVLLFDFEKLIVFSIDVIFLD